MHVCVCSFPVFLHVIFGVILDLEFYENSLAQCSAVEVKYSENRLRKAAAEESDTSPGICSEQPKAAFMVELDLGSHLGTPVG